MTTQALSKRERLPIPRGWIILGFVALSWGIVALVVIGFMSLMRILF